MSTARTPEDFQHAAETYQKLVKLGVRNGHLFYNLGTAMVMAQKHDEAVIPLIRAERYLGGTWEVRHNLFIAIAGREKNEFSSLPWYRLPLFWHYGLSFESRITISVISFAAFWLALLMGKLGKRRMSKFILALSVIMLALFGSSSAATIQAEHKAENAALMKEGLRPAEADSGRAKAGGNADQENTNPGDNIVP